MIKRIYPKVSIGISNNNKKKASKLKLILEYNKDDCIATWKIAEWVLKKQ